METTKKLSQMRIVVIGKNENWKRQRNERKQRKVLSTRKESGARDNGIKGNRKIGVQWGRTRKGISLPAMESKV